MTADEHPKPKTTREQIAKLPPVFKKGGVVTAASASGICDGAAAVIIASEEAVSKHGLTPLARIVGYGIAGKKKRSLETRGDCERPCFDQLHAHILEGQQNSKQSKMCLFS